jgi:RND superfamily putative drug exporter
VLGALALPLRDLEVGFPEIGQFPRQVESMRAWHALEKINSAGTLTPVDILVTNPPGKPILASTLAVSRAARFLQADPRVKEVRTFIGQASPGFLELARSLGIRMEESLPPRARWFLSRDGEKTLIQVVLKSGLADPEREAFHDRLVKLPWTDFLFVPGVTVHVGGLTALNRDLEDASLRSLPRIAALVVCATLLMLFAMTRSWLIPVKAVLANLLTVAATVGGTLGLFRSDAGARLMGLDSPLQSVPPGLPIMVFCVVFGLSMDYEVFLIARIKEAHDRGMDDIRAIEAGLGATGGVITSAAAIMAIVFGGFALTDLVVIKMLGVALALGVLLDATVVRLLAIPALMAMAGRFNWYPGEPARKLRAGLPPAT